MPSTFRNHTRRTHRTRWALALTCLLSSIPSAFGSSVSSIRFPAPHGSPSVRTASDFPGSDLGAQITAAYADLPAHGGAILLTESGTISTPIVFGTNGKPVLLIGLPGNIITLPYSGATGTAITFDCGTNHRMGL